MAATVELFYDLGSARSWLAAARIEAVVQAGGAVLAWRPVTRGALRAAAGLPPVTEAERRYELALLARRAPALGLQPGPAAGAAPDTVKAMQLAVAAEERGHQVPYLRRAFQALWREGLDLSDEKVLARLADEVGARGRALVERIRSGHVQARLAANTEEAARRGAFDVPACFVGEALLMGDDLSDLEAALEKSP